MQRFILCILAVVTAVMGINYIRGRADPSGAETGREYAVPSPVYGEIKKGTKVYEGTDEKGNCYVCDSRERVLILRDFSLKWYLVEGEALKGWVKAQDISIPPDEPAARDDLTAAEIEGYINSSDMESGTDRLIWVDIHRQQTYVLKKRAGKFALEKRITCSTGRNKSPTTRGLFETSDRGEWFYSTRLKSGAKYWTRFNGSYLFHSVAMNKEGEVTDPILGEKRSSGCVRMSVEDAKYIYDNIKSGTAVWVN